MVQVSQRAKEVQASPIRKLMPYALKAKSEGVKVYHLNIGQPDIETPEVMLNAYRNFNEKVVAYGPSQGLEEYLKGLVGYYSTYDIKLDTEDIIVTTAGSEAVMFALLGACDYGDEVIVPEPFYTNYNGFAEMTGVKIKPLTTQATDGFSLPEDDKIINLITKKTKAIMICNPGNPTGTVYTRSELERLADIALKYNLYIISDEVYREFVYDGLVHTSVLNFDYISDRSVVVDSVSKRYSACGSRVGCIVSRNKDFMSAVLKFAQARLCPPTVDQVAASACLSLTKEYFKEVISEYDRRRNIVYEELLKIPGVVCKKPQGAFYVFPKLPIDDAEKFSIWLLSEFRYNGETVMAAPAEGFYSTPGQGKDELRIAYVLNSEELKKAMLIFRLGLEEYNKRL